MIHPCKSQIVTIRAIWADRIYSDSTSIKEVFICIYGLYVCSFIEGNSIHWTTTTQPGRHTDRLIPIPLMQVYSVW